MADGILGLYIFIAISVSSSLIAHWKMKSFWSAVGASVALSVMVFQLASYLDLGHMDPLIIISVVTSSLLALAIASAIGLLFRCGCGRP
jgi:hypothetical protein